MPTRPMVFHVNGHEISATFSDTKNETIYRHIKQILLSSFASHVPNRSRGDILVPLQQQRYNKDSDSPCTLTTA